MTSFVALNIEPEEDTEEEVDDTKEIQIEEALKLYQSALKLHSQGSSFFDETEAAYSALFKSEIFTYVESLSETKRLELYGDIFVDDDVEFDDAVAVPVTAPPGGADGAPSTLPQILYLSYKNHGLFLLDRLMHHLVLSKAGHSKNDDLLVDIGNVRTAAVQSLNYFAEALERDDSDLGLWRRISRICALLGSQRAARFCLEAALDSARDGIGARLPTLNLEECSAKEELRDAIQLLQDRLSESQLSARLPKSKSISVALKKLMDPCPGLPSSLGKLNPNGSKVTAHMDGANCREISASARTWSSVGKSILHQINMESQGVIDVTFGTCYRIDLPRESPSVSVFESGSAGINGFSSRRTNLITGPQPSIASVHKATQHGEAREMSGPVGTGINNCPPVEDSVELQARPALEEDYVDPLQPASTLQPVNPMGKENENQVVSHVENHEDSNAATRASQPERRQAIPANVVSLPTRKRSSESAGMQESVEGARVRSKRIRARAETGPDEENTVIELSQYYEERLQIYTQADHWIFGVAGGLLSRLGIRGLGSLEELQDTVAAPNLDTSSGSTSNITELAMKDLKTALSSWDLEKSTILLHREAPDDTTPSFSTGRNPGLAIFLSHSKHSSQKGPVAPSLTDSEGLVDFVQKVNESWTCLDEVAELWIMELLDPKNRQCEHENREPSCTGRRSRYTGYLWPDILKETIVQVLIKQDEQLFPKCKEGVQSFNPWNPSTLHDELQLKRIFKNEDLVEVVQAIFELHLDVYGRITNPSSEVDYSIRIMQQDRLGRWASLASEAMSKRSPPYTNEFVLDTLYIRHLWSAVIYVDLTEVSARDHVIFCLQDLKGILKDAGSPVIELQNNAIMPELSVEATEREIARLTTMDFFLDIFDIESNNPLKVIESLEPILEKPVVESGEALEEYETDHLPDSNVDGINDDAQKAFILGENNKIPRSTEREPHILQMVEYLDKASISLRLSLWRRLRTAYETVNYPPMVFSCYLRSINLIITYLQSQSYTDDAPEKRSNNLVYWLRIVDDLVGKALTLGMENASAFECMDDERLQAAMESCSALIRLIHAFALWEDSIRVGQSAAPVQASGPASTTYTASTNKFREMQIRVWMLLYILLREAMAQNSKTFPTPKEDLADYLKMLHHALGVRQYCKSSKKIFLKFMKVELLRLNAVESWETDIAQVVYDLNGLKLCPNFQGIQDHGCSPDNLDRRSALEMLDFVIAQAHTINVKDLLKSDLKSAIDRMQQVIGSPKQSISQQSSSQLFNKRSINAYLKSPINPVQLYRSLQGIGDIPSVSVSTEYSMIAAKGWYFLLGHMTLAKFKSQKRVSPGPTDDLDIAMTFFRLDLEFDMEKWETWYRLAQVYDAKIEEDTTWNADKLNNHKTDLNVLQRHTVHCYAMAVAAAVRCAEASFDNAAKLSQLYFDYGSRIYASSREPFSMEAFSLKDFDKFYSGETEGMYKERPFRGFQLYPAWNLASVLFRRALTDQSQSWLNWYMLGKCLWKMYTHDPLRPEKSRPITFHEALEAFSRAIEYVPEKRDSRHPDKDPILEPHYKLVSIVHKLVQKRIIAPSEGCRILDATHYTRKIQHVQDFEEWEGYILCVLKSLRAADKSNWHHRMIARAAHIIYDDSPDNIMAAAAKLELTQQIFTKTMTVQVWKPEHERPGRHFVYTGRYVCFFIQILYHMSDRVSLEALAKRIRKKAGDFVEHSRIWQELCMAYLKLIRAVGSIPEGHEDTIYKSIPHDIFVLNSTRLESWATSSTASPILDLLREIVELKKLNNNLMKSTPIDDLVGDTFALLYEKQVPELVAKTNDEENRDRMRVDHLLTNAEVSTVDRPSPAPSADTSVPKPRPKTVGRREIQRRAEALVSKPAALLSSAKTPKIPAVPVTSISVFPPPPGPAISVVVPPLPIKDESVAREVGSSVPGSLHDSADDESELSDIGEIMEKEKPEAKPMFPGLLGRSGAEETGEEDMDGVEEEDDGGGDGGEDDLEDGAEGEKDEEDKVDGVREEEDRAYLQ